MSNFFPSVSLRMKKIPEVQTVRGFSIPRGAYGNRFCTCDVGRLEVGSKEKVEETSFPPPLKVSLGLGVS